jgi:hypothetical protein
MKTVSVNLLTLLKRSRNGKNMLLNRVHYPAAQHVELQGGGKVETGKEGSGQCCKVSFSLVNYCVIYNLIEASSE